MTSRALAIAALLLCGCPGVMRPLEKPIVELEQVDLVAASLSGLDLRAHFDLTNRNNVGLPLVAVDWEVSIGSAAPVRGRTMVSETLPARGSAPIVVDVHVEPGAAVGMVRAVGAGERRYHLRGTLNFDSKHGEIAAVFDESGAIAN